MMEGTQRTSNRAVFSFILIFHRFFQKALVGIKIFYFFTIFSYFSLNKHHKRCNHKNWQLQLRCGLQKFSKFSEKHAKPLSIFFLYFLIFLAILIRPNRASPSLGRVQMVQLYALNKNFRIPPSKKVQF